MNWASLLMTGVQAGCYVGAIRKLAAVSDEAAVWFLSSYPTVRALVN